MTADGSDGLLILMPMMLPVTAMEHEPATLRSYLLKSVSMRVRVCGLTKTNPRSMP